MANEKIKSIFKMSEFEQFRDRWQTRINELNRRRRYYDGSIYSPYFTHLRQQGEAGWLWPRLYQGVKPLYLPLSRAVDVDAGIVPGGWELPEETPDAWQQGVEQVFDWSDWARDGLLYVHYGAQYGCVGLKISDMREMRQVMIKPVKPTCFLLVESGDYDDTPMMAIYTDTRIDATGEEYEYAEVVTAESIRTFRDGLPEVFGGREVEYANELGFVPFVEIEHIKTGQPFGEATYQKAIPLLDEVNQLASYMADIIAKHAEPQWAISGAEASDLVKAGDNIWFLPEGSRAEPLVAQVDFAGVLDFIREIRDQVHGALPELAFDELRKKDQIATATLELQLMELVLKIKRSRPNYDHGLADALRMAGRAGASMSIGEISALDDEALAFDQDRPVLPMDKMTAIQLQMQQISLEQMQALNGVEPAPNGSDEEDEENA